MEICDRCIIPTTFPGITIENGTCTFCRNFDISPKVEKKLLGRDKLLEVLAPKKSNMFDCVVGLSGGKDSSYAIYYIVRELGLNPLAVFFDNGFISEQAKENIKNLCESLKVELVIRRASKYRHKIIKENLYVSKFTGKFHACFNCENILRTTVNNTAINYNIPFIVYGARQTSKIHSQHS